VDYKMRAGFLAGFQSTRGIQGSDQRQFVQELLATVSDGRIKMYMTTVGLHYRRAHASLFLSGEYVPLKVEGTKKKHVCAFARIYEDRAVVAIVPVLLRGLCRETESFPFDPSLWEDTWVIVPSWRPASCYQNLLTGEILSSTETEGKQSLRLAEILGSCPVALLERMT
jgi:(1->4)-alpha-D-glucan 1-alpha-D-glucosylmutase